MCNPHMSPAQRPCYDGETPVDEAQPVEVTDTTVTETPDTQPVEETPVPEPPKPEPLFSAADVERQIAERDAEWAGKLAARDTEVATIRAAHDAAMINVTLVDVIKGGDAISVEQVMAILRPCTSMIAGQPSVQIEGYHMTPREAVQWMRNQVDRYGNLFRSNVIAGIGGHSTAGGARAPKGMNLRNMDAKQYREAKRENPSAFGFGGVG